MLLSHVALADAAVTWVEPHVSLPSHVAIADVAITWVKFHMVFWGHVAEPLAVAVIWVEFLAPAL